MNYILDTDILIDFARGVEEAVAWIKEHRDKGDELATTWINSCELLKGVHIRDKPEEISWIRNILSSLSVLLPTVGTSELYAQLYAKLRQKGKTTSDFDILIASISLENGATLVSCDKGFEEIPGLKLEKWHNIEDRRDRLNKTDKEADLTPLSGILKTKESGQHFKDMVRKGRDPKRKKRLQK